MGAKLCLDCGNEEFFGALELHRSPKHPECYAVKILDFGEAWNMAKSFLKSRNMLIGEKVADNALIKTFVVGASQQSGLYYYIHPDKESQSEPSPDAKKVDEGAATADIPVGGFLPRTSVKSVAQNSKPFPTSVEMKGAVQGSS